MSIQDIDYVNYSASTVQFDRALSMLHQELKILRNIINTYAAQDRNANKWPPNSLKNIRDRWLVIKSYIEILKCFDQVCQGVTLLERNFLPTIDKISTYW
jgi:hypothetical protein